MEVQGLETIAGLNAEEGGSRKAGVQELLWKLLLPR